MQPIGPVEYVIVNFDGNQFNGEIVPELIRLRDKGMIRIIDLVVVSKDKGGDVRIFEANELSKDVSDALIKLDMDFTGLLSEDDVMMVSEELPNNSTAAAMLFEHVWATEFAQAVRKANGRLVKNLRIPGDVVEAARQVLVEAA